MKHWITEQTLGARGEKPTCTIVFGPSSSFEACKEWFRTYARKDLIKYLDYLSTVNRHAKCRAKLQTVISTRNYDALIIWNSDV